MQPFNLQVLPGIKPRLLTVSGTFNPLQLSQVFINGRPSSAALVSAYIGTFPFLPAGGTVEVHSLALDYTTRVNDIIQFVIKDPISIAFDYAVTITVAPNIAGLIDENTDRIERIEFELTDTKRTLDRLVESVDKLSMQIYNMQEGT